MFAFEIKPYDNKFDTPMHLHLRTICVKYRIYRESEVFTGVFRGFNQVIHPKFIELRKSKIIENNS